MSPAIITGFGIRNPNSLVTMADPVIIARRMRIIGSQRRVGPQVLQRTIPARGRSKPISL
jgi:hypothetical protein